MLFTEQTLKELSGFQSLVSAANNEFERTGEVKNNTNNKVELPDVADAIDCTGATIADSGVTMDEHKEVRAVYFDASLINQAYTTDNQNACEKALPFFPNNANIDYANFVTNGVNPILVYMGRSRKNIYIPSAEQLRVLYSCAPRLLIDSGPGTGKTTTIVRKAFMEQNIFGLTNDDILAFTYTDAGATSMNSRYEKLTNEFSGNRSMVFSTIHSWCKRFMTIYAGSFDVITETSSAIESHWDEEAQEYFDTEVKLHDILTECMETAGINTKEMSPIEFYSILSVVIERNIESEEELRTTENLVDIRITLKDILAAKRLFNTHKSSLGVIDYNDMLEGTRDILIKIRDGEYKYNNELQEIFYKFKSIYVDEFQDITPLQMEIIDLLVEINAKNGVRLTCIGDMDQAIYSFKGADVRIIMQFVEKYKNDGLDVIFLTQNRRSEEVIIELANWIIGHNELRFPKKIQGMPGNPRTGGSITAYADLNGDLARGLIKKRIKEEWSLESPQMNKFAIMYRDNRQITPYVNILIENRIPFCTKLDKRRKINYPPHMTETSDLLGLIDLLRAPANPDLVTRFLNKMIPYLGKDGAVKIAFELRENSDAKLVGILKRETKYDKGREKMIKLREALMDTNTQPGEFLKLLANHYRETFYDYSLKKSKKKADNLAYVVEYLGGKGNLEYLRSEVEMDKVWLVSNSNNTLGVNLTTFSSSKGLEYKNIFILPIPAVSKTQPKYEKLSDNAFKLIQEEARRLFYVTVTRAITNIVYFYDTVSGAPFDLNTVSKNMFTSDILSFLIHKGVPFGPRMIFVPKVEERQE